MARTTRSGLGMKTAFLATAVALAWACTSSSEEPRDREDYGPDASEACALAEDVPCAKDDPDDCCEGSARCLGYENIGYDLERECRIGEAVHSCYWKEEPPEVGHAEDHVCTEDGRYYFGSNNALVPEGFPDTEIVHCTEVEGAPPEDRDELQEWPACD